MDWAIQGTEVTRYLTLIPFVAVQAQSHDRYCLFPFRLLPGGFHTLLPSQECFVTLSNGGDISQKKKIISSVAFVCRDHVFVSIPI